MFIKIISRDGKTFAVTAPSTDVQKRLSAYICAYDKQKAGMRRLCLPPTSQLEDLSCA
jgi:hypothetical protein